MIVIAKGYANAVELGMELIPEINGVSEIEIAFDVWTSEAPGPHAGIIWAVTIEHHRKSIVVFNRLIASVHSVSNNPASIEPQMNTSFGQVRCQAYLVDIQFPWLDTQFHTPSDAVPPAGAAVDTDDDGVALSYFQPTGDITLMRCRE